MKNFSEIFTALQSRGARKRMVAAWGVDGHTIAAAADAVKLGLVDVTLVGDENLIAQACKDENVDVSIFTIVHNPDEMKSVANDLYPEIVRALGDNEFLGIRMQLEKMIKMVVSKGQSLEQVQRAFLREYTSMRMDIDIFGHKPDDNAPKGM